MASSAPTLSANFLASFTRPASGETTTRSSSCWSRKYWARMNIAVRERLERHAAEIHAQLVGDLARQLGVRAAREEHQPLVVAERQRGGRGRAGFERAHRRAQCTQRRGHDFLRSA